MWCLFSCQNITISSPRFHTTFSYNMHRCDKICSWFRIVWTNRRREKKLNEEWAFQQQSPDVLVLLSTSEFNSQLAKIVWFLSVWLAAMERERELRQPTHNTINFAKIVHINGNIMEMVDWWMSYLKILNVILLLFLLQRIRTINTRRLNRRWLDSKSNSNDLTLVEFPVKWIIVDAKKLLGNANRTLVMMFRELLFITSTNLWTSIWSFCEQFHFLSMSSLKFYWTHWVRLSSHESIDYSDA